jgi:phosphatidylglycerophosphate synthase
MFDPRFSLLRYRHVLAEVRRSYTPEKAAEERRSELVAAVFYRPVSFWVSPLFLWLGFSADGVALLSIGLSVAMPLMVWASGELDFALIVGLGLLAQVLDCVDGNIARVTQRFSTIGVMLDGLSTLFFWSMYFIAVGVVAERQHVGWIGAQGEKIGLALAVLMLAQREVEDTASQYLGRGVSWGAGETLTRRFDLNRYGKLLEQLVAFGALAVAGLLRRVDLFLGTIAAYQVALFLFWLPRFVRSTSRRRRVDSAPQRYG